MLRPTRIKRKALEKRCCTDILFQVTTPFLLNDITFDLFGFQKILKHFPSCNIGTLTIFRLILKDFRLPL